MAKKVLTEQEKLQQEKVEERVSAVDQFFKENGKYIWGCVIALLVIWAAILCYQRFYLQPKRAEASAQMYPAENNFAAGNYDLALNGDGNVLGFAQVIGDYGKKAGAAAYLYAGICELQLGNYEAALGYLKKYSGKEPILAARALACEGDAYVGLGDYAAAVRSYKAAAQRADNVFAAAYLIKEASAHEALGQNAEALACYNAVKTDYPQSIEAYDIDKYIARVSE